MTCEVAKCCEGSWIAWQCLLFGHSETEVLPWNTLQEHVALITANAHLANSTGLMSILQHTRNWTIAFAHWLLERRWWCWYNYLTHFTHSTNLIEFCSSLRAVVLYHTKCHHGVQKSCKLTMKSCKNHNPIHCDIVSRISAKVWPKARIRGPESRLGRCQSALVPSFIWKLVFFRTYNPEA